MIHKKYIAELKRQIDFLEKICNGMVMQIVKLNNKLKRKKCPNCGFVACDKHSKQCADIDKKLKDMERRE